MHFGLIVPVLLSEEVPLVVLHVLPGSRIGLPAGTAGRAGTAALRLTRKVGTRRAAGPRRLPSQHGD